MTRSQRSLTVILSALVVVLALASKPAPASAQVVSGEWTSLPLGGTEPSPRREYAAVYDEANHRYLIFGGLRSVYGGYVLNNEVWALTLGPTPTWSQIPIAGATPGERHSPQWGYDPARNRLLIFGGYGRHYPESPLAYLNDVWELSLNGTPAWTELFPAGTPPAGRLAGAAVYDVYRQRFVGFGGTAGLPVDTWQLDLSGEPAWLPVVTDQTAPPGSYGMASIYDPKGDRMIVFGGSTSDEYHGVHNDTWALNLRGAQPAWHQLQPTGVLPVARRTLSSIYDPLRDRMVIFGGWDSSENGAASFLSDTWALDLQENPQWAQLSPAGAIPAGRDATAAVYDPVDDRFVVFGGWTAYTMFGDTWLLGWGGSGVSASMTPQASAEPTEAHVQWSVENAASPYAAVYRRQAGTPWTSIATAEADASGVVSFVDDTVTPGETYGYMVVVPSQKGGEFGGETWVEVPTTTGVGPSSGLAFALDRVRPNPVRAEFGVNFVLPDAQAASLELYDLSGRRIASREVGSLGAGRHTVALGRASDYGAGMYFLRLTRAGSSLSERVVIGAP